jgi:multisubunit Na+/H+ antiporter MnhE subunit
MVLTNIFNPESFVVGYLAALLAVVWWLRDEPIEFNIAKFPQRLLAFITYSVFMIWQIFVSGWDVTLRIFGIRPIRAGIIAVNVQDMQNSEFISGASAHSITITPGEMVVEYDKTCQIMYVHCIDIDESQKKLDPDQTSRLQSLKRIIGS